MNIAFNLLSHPPVFDIFIHTHLDNFSYLFIVTSIDSCVPFTILNAIGVFVSQSTTEYISKSRSRSVAFSERPLLYSQ